MLGLKSCLTFLRTDANHTTSFSERDQEAPPEIERKWLTTISEGLAETLNIPLSSGHGKLQSFPEGYRLVMKVREKKKHADYYLKGTPFTSSFRSPNEFLPHALWLLRDSTLDHSLCQCQYHPLRSEPSSRKSQMHIVSLSNDDHAPVDLKKSCGSHSASRPRGDQKGQTPKMNSLLHVVRRGETVWAALNPPISAAFALASIKFWPCVVVEKLSESATAGRTRQVKIKPLGPLEVQVVDERRLLPYQAYLLPRELIHALKRVCIKEVQPYEEPTWSINFGDFEYSFPPPQPAFDLIALSYAQALLEASDHNISWSIAQGVPSIPKYLDSSGVISCKPMSRTQTDNTGLIIRFGLEQIAVGDFLRLRISREELPYSDCVLSPSRPGAYSLSVFFELDSLELASGAKTRSLFLQVTSWSWRLVEESKNLYAVGVLYELADSDSADVTPEQETRIPQAYYGYVFRSILQPGYMAEVPLDEVAGKYYPAPQVMSRFYDLYPYIEASSVDRVQYHLQTLGGLWPEERSFKDLKFYSLSCENATPDRKHIIEYLEEVCVHAQERDVRLEDNFGFDRVKEEDI
ncbi:hypothetical protein GYMLUDRAFT_253842 [Collybiopsis luxurians FD-317 M1]|nr:hypothetical protein GYMLUDRAFT_253842 [Collybiopsis luxurians FD-317 M1]